MMTAAIDKLTLDQLRQIREAHYQAPAHSLWQVQIVDARMPECTNGEWLDAVVASAPVTAAEADYLWNVLVCVSEDRVSHIPSVHYIDYTECLAPSDYIKAAIGATIRRAANRVKKIERWIVS
jgi:hypothetical protein